MDTLTLEQNIVAAALLDPAMIDRAGALTGEAFTDRTLAAWWDALCDVWTRHGVADVVSAAAAGQLDPAYGTELATSAAALDGDAVEHWSNLLVTEARRLRTINSLRAMAVSLENNEVADVDEALEHVMLESGEHDPTNRGELVGDVAERLRDAPLVPPVPTGVDPVDEALSGGVANGRVLLIGGRPGMGKSAVVHQIAASMAAVGHPVVLCSPEMNANEVTTRMIQSLSGATTLDMQTLPLPDPALQAIDRIVQAEWPMLLLPMQVTTVPGIAAAAREAAARWQRPPLVIVDHLGWLRAPGFGNNRQQELTHIIQSLKTLAGRLDCPVIGLAQLNRKLEERADKRPVSADLRESGELEQSADQIMFVYRDEVYNEHSPDAGKMELIVTKSRNGQTRRVMSKWDAGRFRITGVDPGDTGSIPQAF